MSLANLYNQQHAIRKEILRLTSDKRRMEKLLNNLSNIEEQIRRLKGR